MVVRGINIIVIQPYLDLPFILSFDHQSNHHNAQDPQIRSDVTNEPSMSRWGRGGGRGSSRMNGLPPGTWVDDADLMADGRPVELFPVRRLACLPTYLSTYPRARSRSRLMEVSPLGV